METALLRTVAFGRLKQDMVCLLQTLAADKMVVPEAVMGVLSGQCRPPKARTKIVLTPQSAWKTGTPLSLSILPQQLDDDVPGLLLRLV